MLPRSASSGDATMTADARRERSSTDSSPSLFADATIARPALVVASAGGLFTSQSCVSRLTTWFVAEHLAGLGVERDDRVRVEGCRRRALRRRSPARDFQPARTARRCRGRGWNEVQNAPPVIGQSVCVRPSLARRTARRHDVETPNGVAVFRVERVDMTRDAGLVAARVADEHEPVRRDRRHRASSCQVSSPRSRDPKACARPARRARARARRTCRGRVAHPRTRSRDAPRAPRGLSSGRSTTHFAAQLAASIAYERVSVVKYIVPAITIGPVCSADTSGNV